MHDCLHVLGGRTLSFLSCLHACHVSSDDGTCRSVTPPESNRGDMSDEIRRRQRPSIAAPGSCYRPANPGSPVWITENPMNRDLSRLDMRMWPTIGCLRSNRGDDIPSEDRKQATWVDLVSEIGKSVSSLIGSFFGNNEDLSIGRDVINDTDTEFSFIYGPASIRGASTSIAQRETSESPVHFRRRMDKVVDDTYALSSNIPRPLRKSRRMDEVDAESSLNVRIAQAHIVRNRLRESKLAKYRSMIKCGTPIMAVATRMKKDGCNDDLVHCILDSPTFTSNQMSHNTAVPGILSFLFSNWPKVIFVRFPSCCGHSHLNYC